MRSRAAARRIAEDRAADCRRAKASRAPRIEPDPRGGNISEESADEYVHGTQPQAVTTAAPLTLGPPTLTDADFEAFISAQIAAGLVTVQAAQLVAPQPALPPPPPPPPPLLQDQLVWPPSFASEPPPPTDAATRRIKFARRREQAALDVANAPLPPPAHQPAAAEDAVAITSHVPPPSEPSALESDPPAPPPISVSAMMGKMDHVRRRLRRQIEGNTGAIAQIDALLVLNAPQQPAIPPPPAVSTTDEADLDRIAEYHVTTGGGRFVDIMREAPSLTGPVPPIAKVQSPQTPTRDGHTPLRRIPTFSEKMLGVLHVAAATPALRTTPAFSRPALAASVTTPVATPTPLAAKVALPPNRHTARAKAGAVYTREASALLGSQGPDASMHFHADAATVAEAAEEVGQWAEFGVNANTAKMDDRAWVFWERVCDAMGTSPTRTADDAHYYPKRQAELLAQLMLYAFNNCKPTDKANSTIKPLSALAYPLAIIRTFARWGVRMPGYVMIKSALHGLYRKYIQLHGVLALSARRAENR